MWCWSATGASAAWSATTLKAANVPLSGRRERRGHRRSSAPARHRGDLRQRGRSGACAEPRTTRPRAACWSRSPTVSRAGRSSSRRARSTRHLPIIARSHSEEETEHLRRHGASKVIMGEHLIAQAMIDDAREAVRAGGREPRPASAETRPARGSGLMPHDTPLISTIVVALALAWLLRRARASPSRSRRWSATCSPASRSDRSRPASSPTRGSPTSSPRSA